MSSAIQYNWNIFCNTEGCFRQWIQKNRPTTCPVDAEHDVDQNQSFYTITQMPPNLLNQSISFGYYQGQGINFTATANTTTTYNMSFPYDITILVGCILIENSNQGDILNITLQPNTIIGILIQDANIGDTVIYPNSTVIQHAVKGTTMHINEDGNAYIIKSIDIMNSTITLCSPLVANYTTGMYVDQTIYIVQNFLLPSKIQIMLGNLNPTSTIIPANYIFQFLYTNNSNVDKIFNFFLQCY